MPACDRNYRSTTDLRKTCRNVSNKSDHMLGKRLTSRILDVLQSLSQGPANMEILSFLVISISRNSCITGYY